MLKRRLARHAARGAAAAGLSLLLSAAALQISPVTIEFSASENATGLTLRNPGDTPLYGQVRVFQWGQAHGEDVLTPTTDVIASPPLIEVVPHGDQLVRLVRANASFSAAGAGAAQSTQAASGAVGLAGGERSYRLQIDELPAPGTAGTEGVTIRLRYSVPVFVEAPAGGAAQRAQIAAVELLDAGGHRWDVTRGLLGYALAGQGRQWSVPVPADAKFGGALKVRATVNTRPVEETVTVEQGG